MIDQLISCARLCDWTETERLLYEHWSTSCPQLYAPHLDQPWDVRIDDDQICTYAWMHLPYGNMT